MKIPAYKFCSRAIKIKRNKEMEGGKKTEEAQEEYSKKENKEEKKWDEE